MNTFLLWLEEKFMPPMAKISEQRHLRAIRDGVISTLSLIIVGSFFIIIAQPPSETLKELVAPYVGDIMIPFRLTVSLMSLYASYGMGYSLAKSYKLDGVSGGVLSLAAFLMATVPLNFDAVMESAVNAGIEGAEAIGWVLPMGNLGGSGMFTAILTMIFAVETLRLLKKYKVTLKMPEQVPESVARSFEALIPAAVIIVVMWVIRVLLDFDINAQLLALFEPVKNIMGNNILGAIVPVLLITFLWTAGVHGDSIIGTIIRPMWLVLIEENIVAAADGVAMTNIAPEPFFQWLIWIGGSGATLSLCVMMMFSKSEYLKKVGRFSIIPGIFNINEPIIFGTPLVMNPILAIPFIVGPTITATLSYFAVSAGLVGKFYIIAPWTLPAPIGAYMATGGNWGAVIMVLVNILITGVIYYPFFKVYEKKLVAEENATLEAKKAEELNSKAVKAQ